MRSLGYGGVSAVAQVTGIARGTIHRALKEIQDPRLMSARDQVGALGCGRKRIVEKNPRILKRLKELVESSTRGDPMSPLLCLRSEGNPIRAETKRRNTQCLPTRSIRDVNLIENAGEVVETVVHEIGHQTLEILILSAEQVAGPRTPGKRSGDIRYHGSQLGRVQTDGPKVESEAARLRHRREGEVNCPS
jgi:hypothetical protein